MNQQINLYLPIFRQERKVLSLRTTGLALAIVTVALLGIWGFAFYNVGSLARAVDELQKQHAAQQRLSQVAGAQLEAQGSLSEIQAAVQTLNVQLAERTQVLDLLRSGVAGESHGFAARMHALARQHTEGLWLDELVLASGRDSGGMTLRGRAIDPALVPRYLRQLRREPTLAGLHFDDVVFDRREKHVDAATRETNTQTRNSQTRTLRFSVSSGGMAEHLARLSERAQ